MKMIIILLARAAAISHETFKHFTMLLTYILHIYNAFK